ncbi:MAG TPA: hypothetical protein VF575_05510 [Candidatus Saccharimonadales bacterium]|jgi:cytoskeletal protein RodZ
MDNDRGNTRSADNKKTKLIAWVVILAAIAIVYIVVASRNSQEPAPASSTTTSKTSAADTTGASETNAGEQDTAASSAYTDGTYTATGSYRTPEGTESIDVTLTIAKGAVTDSSVETSASDPKSARYQEDFTDNYKQYVVGKSLDEINLSRVSGSSLTSNGFNTALEDIKTEAATPAG